MEKNEEHGNGSYRRLQETPIYGSSCLGIHRYHQLPALFVPSFLPPEEMQSTLELLGSDRSGKDTRGKKGYELSNHLGNVLAVVSDLKLGYVTALGRT